jgi:hypothetical protein
LTLTKGQQEAFHATLEGAGPRTWSIRERRPEGPAVAWAIHRPGLLGSGLEVSDLASALEGKNKKEAMIASSRSSQTMRIPPCRPGGPALYRKTYVYATVRERLAGLLRTTGPRSSRARREWTALHVLGQQGLGTPAPVAMREIRSLGLLHRADLLTLEVAGGEPCPAFLVRASAAERASFLSGLAADLCRLHEAGISLGRPRLRDILARPHLSAHQAVFLDLGRVHCRSRLGWGARARDLGDLEASARRLLRRTERLAFLGHYFLGVAGPHPPRDRVVARVVARSRWGPEAGDPRL